MRQRDKDKYRKVGSAQARFVNSEQIQWRDDIAAQIKEIARQHRGEFRETGEKWLQKKADRLLRLAFRFRYCCYEYLLLTCRSCGQRYIGQARCECRICPECSRKHYYRIKERLYQMLKTLTCIGTKRIMLLTLTLRATGGDKLASSDVKRLFRCVRKLVKTLYPKEDGCGAVGVFEMGNNNNIHVHLIVYGDYVPQRQISKEWHRITGDSYIVDIRQVKQRKKQVNYILKYIYKPYKGNDPKDVARYLDIITGVRRVHTYGILYNLKCTEDYRVLCLFCGGQLGFARTDGGLEIPIDALFFGEAREMAATTVH